MTKPNQNVFMKPVEEVISTMNYDTSMFEAGEIENLCYAINKFVAFYAINRISAGLPVEEVDLERAFSKAIEEE